MRLERKRTMFIQTNQPIFCKPIGRLRVNLFKSFDANARIWRIWGFISDLKAEWRSKKFHHISQNKGWNLEKSEIRETAQSLSGAIRDPGHIQNSI